MKLDRRTLPLNAMRAFEVAARHCHLRRGAQELGVTHGALSRQVKQLESQLGVPLFNRDHNCLSLTHAGERLYQSVNSALDMLTASALYLDPDSMSGDLTLSTTPSTASSWFLQIVGQFAQRYPEINLHLHSMMPNSRQIDSQIDVAVCYGQPSGGNRHIEVLFRESYFPVCNPSLITSGKDIQQVSDLVCHTLLCDRHNHWPRWFEKAGAANTAIVNKWSIDEPFLVLDAVKRGYGIGLVDRIEAYQELDNGQLIRLSETTVEANDHYYLVHNKQGLSLRAQVFVDYLKQKIEQIRR